MSDQTIKNNQENDPFAMYHHRMRLDPTLPTTVSIDKTDQGVEVSFEQLDPTRFDTITKKIILDAENLRIEGFKFKIDAPTLSLPRTFNVVQGKDEDNGDVKVNPWLKPSFAGAFNAIINDLLDKKRDARYQEALVEIDTRKSIIEIAQTNADLTRQSYALQSQEKMLEAITQFVSAAISTAQIVQNARNTNTAAKRVDDRMRERDNKITELENNLPNKWAGDKATGPTKQQQEELDRLNLPHSKNIKKLKDEREMMAMRRTEEIQRETRDLNNEGNAVFQLMKEVNQGVNNLIDAELKLRIGYVEALKQENEGYMQAMQKFNETSARARDDQKAEFDRFLDFLIKIIDSDFKAHSLGHSG